MTVIRVENIGKRYRVGALQGGALLRDRLAETLRHPLRALRPKRKETFWALKDISFEVKEGEVLGLIGRNGAGKSTLLKILSRITKPTLGHAEIHGRVGSLLEVGTGFHPELSGRENVFLNGAILGMRRREIVRKFDEIVAFAEVEKFIDTPVKHYSSGMYIRLAFAVAAHLETEILFVDEVLSVGDVAFQKKCLGKMGDVARHGRTIIFVSHNMAPVSALCSRAILLNLGHVVVDGPTGEVVATYHARTSETERQTADLCAAKRTGTGKAQFTSFSLRAYSHDGELLERATTGCNLVIETGIEARSELPESNVAIIIYDSAGYRLIDANLNQRNEYLKMAAGEKVRVRFVLKELLLKPGTYFVGLWIGRDNIEETDAIDSATSLAVIPWETQVHPKIFPGPYLCRFDASISLEAGRAGTSLPNRQ